MATFSGSRAECWWFNPRDGGSFHAGTCQTTGRREFVTPDSNDWVLVMDDYSAELPAPGIIVA
jgi:hypothetical protein